MSEFCPTCHATIDLERHSTFCPNCGTPLGKVERTEVLPRCGACGRELNAGDRFCDGCGHPTAAVEAPLASPVGPQPVVSRTLPRDSKKGGLAGVARSGRWWGPLVAFLLLPFWATSEIRQTPWPWGGKFAAFAGVWLLTITVASASPGVPDPVPDPTPRATDDIGAASPEPTPQPTPEDRFADAPPGWPKPPDDAREAFVASVTDGDTIVLRGIDVGAVDAATDGRKTRLIGIDTPEVFSGAECYGSEASAFTKRELDQKSVLVDFDVERIDRFGRALAYVWLRDGTFFNARLASEGYALQLTVPPNVQYAELFSRLVTEAREANRGLWEGCTVDRDGDGQDSAPSSDRDCPSFGSQPEAQRFYEEQGGPAQDPHRLDADNDGVACEGLQGGGPPRTEPPAPAAAPTQAPPSSSNCHPSYPDFCIPPPPPDLDCGDVSQRDFTVRHDVPNPDPHGFDGNDNDGRGCES